MVRNNLAACRHIDQLPSTFSNPCQAARVIVGAVGIAGKTKKRAEGCVRFETTAPEPAEDTGQRAFAKDRRLRSCLYQRRQEPIHGLIARVDSAGQVIERVHGDIVELFLSFGRLPGRLLLSLDVADERCDLLPRFRIQIDAGALQLVVDPLLLIGTP